MVLDQKYRANWTPENWSKQIEIDSSNLGYVEKIMKEHGYPGKSMVGEKTASAAWYVIQHSDKIDVYIDEIKQAADNGELPFRLYAMMLDRHLMYNDKAQIYGTQGSSYFIGSPKEINFIWPIQNPDSVNILRKGVFGTTVEEYGKDLFGDDFEFKNLTIEEALKIKNSVN
ncbi:DUF6624 domain-containing protein [Croceitalea marina]|uniref:DUF6624 domain-containing protein n=1 Tax=Croceitalea marina TaxID=1775166 RepID=A0ABW5MU88_9FLAO